MLFRRKVQGFYTFSRIEECDLGRLSQDLLETVDIPRNPDGVTPSGVRRLEEVNCQMMVSKLRGNRETIEIIQFPEFCGVQKREIWTTCASRTIGPQQL